MSDADERLDLIDAAVYGDAFDCAVTFEELWRYSRVRCTREELRARLSDPTLRRVLFQRDGYYGLAGREELAEQRARSRRCARILHRRAERVSRWLRHVPFVRGIVLTGSIAADDAGPDADVDVLLLVSPGRLASLFALLGPASRLLSRRLFCPNYYLSEAHLTLARRDRYVARELVQCRPLAGGEALVAANPWVREHLPNSRAPAARPAPRPSRAQRLLEWPLRGRLGDRLEWRARRLAHARLAAHHAAAGSPVPESLRRGLDEGVELRFHASELAGDALRRYRARRAELRETLQKGLEPARASASPAQAPHGRVDAPGG